MFVICVLISTLAYVASMLELSGRARIGIYVVGLGTAATAVVIGYRAARSAWRRFRGHGPAGGAALQDALLVDPAAAAAAATDAEASPFLVPPFQAPEGRS